MKPLPPPSGDMEKLLERYLGYNEHPTNVTGCTQDKPCEYHAEKATVLAYIRALEADHKAMHDWIRKHSCEKSCEKDRDPNCYSCQAWNFLESLLIKP